MVSFVDGLFGVNVLAGAVLCWVAGHTVREADLPGRRSFAAFAAVVGLGGIVVGALGIADLGRFGAGETGNPVWSQAVVVFWLFTAVPWFLFALQYTGRYTDIGWRLVALSLVPPSLVVLNVVVSIVGESFFALSATLGSIVSIYTLALALVGAYLVVRTTVAYGHVSAAQGVGLSAAPLVLTLAVNTSLGLARAGDSPALAAGVYTAGMGTAALALGLTFLLYDPFERTPAVGTIGERAIVRETDDLVFVVDDCGRVVKLNQTAVAQLGVDRADALQTRLSDLLDHGADDLSGTETVALQTESGKRRYDPEVSTITTDSGRELGAMLSLRDVTERELREQRLTVLNRVLRHNLRNKVEVVRSRAEALAATDGQALAGHASDGAGPSPDSEHAERIVETADEIADLGRSARTIDQFVSETSSQRPVDVAGAVEDALEAVGRDRPGLTVTVDTSEATQVVTNRRALAAALESAVDNALSYADTTVEVSVTQRADAHVVRVADDGPGIPDGELESLERGTETPLQHGTGLGLWQLKWAVTTLNGDLSFETDDGTTVEIVVPDRGD